MRFFLSSGARRAPGATALWNKGYSQVYVVTGGVLCRSGSRSVLAAYTLKLMGFKHATSMQTGLRGWNE